MADETQNDPVVEDTSGPLQTVEEATPAEAADKAQELKEAHASDNPNDDLAAARPDEGTEISVPPDVVSAEEPEEPTVKVKPSKDFKVPVLEEYEDEQGRTRGKVAGYETPSDLRLSVSIYDPEADSEWVDEDGYIAISKVTDLPRHLAAQIADHPAVEVAE